MAISGGPAVNGLVQAKMGADTAGGKATQFFDAHDCRFNLVIADNAGAVRVDIERQWRGHADGISKLNGAARGEASGDDILGKVARDIRGGTVDLCRVFTRKRATTMRSCAAISINDDLASGQASIAIRSANFKAAGRVDVILGFGQQACWKQVGDDALHIIVQLRLFFALVISRCMLGGDDNRGCSFRLAFAVVAQSDLAFGVRLQKRSAAMRSRILWL
jgi:hypothetical protein